METLNRSLGELHDMRGQMASMGSTLSNYDAKLQSLSDTISDTVHDNTVLQDSVQGASDRILDYNVSGNTCSRCKLVIPTVKLLLVCC